MRKKKSRTRIEIWKKVLLQIIMESDWGNQKELCENFQLVYGFFFSKIKLIKRRKDRKKGKLPILITIVRDERERIGIFLDYYRELGIDHFVIADNGSKDGTLEYLLQQKDVDVFYIKDNFRNGRKEGWINKLMYLYGFHRWYLIVDADELLEWPERKAFDLLQVLRMLEACKISRAGALMIDMYTNGSMFESDLTGGMNSNLYFDSDTYAKIREGKKIIWTGGPRKRVYDMDCYLSKYPLIYLKEGEVLINSHYWYPYHCYVDYPFIFGLLHYKFFTKTDLEKVKQYVKEENHVSHSYEYKCYLEQYNKGNANFYYDGAVKYSDPESLYYVKHIKRISDLKVREKK